MKGLKLLAGAAVAVAAQGCSVARQELRHSGGFPGARMDQRLFDAHESKRLQLIRMTMVLALASRVGVATIRDGQEADAFLTYLENATNEVNYLAAHLYGQAGADEQPAQNGQPMVPARAALYTCRSLGLERPTLPREVEDLPRFEPAPPSGETPPCSTYMALFESDLPQLEYKIGRLVIAALPREQAGRFASSARTGNIAAAAWQFLKLAAASVDGMHRGAAVYRSSQEIVAVTVASMGGTCAPTSSAHRPETVEWAATCLGHRLDDIFDRPAGVAFPRDDQVTPEPLHALFAIIRTSCALLPVDVNTGASTGAGTNGDDTAITSRRQRCQSYRFNPTLRLGPTEIAASAAAQPAEAPGTTAGTGDREP